MKRYAGYQNLFLTDYLEFRFFKNGEKYETISLGEFKDKKIVLTPENGQRLINELEAFLEQSPESIKSGKRLSEIMGAKARRIRDNVAIYLNDESIDAKELEKIALEDDYFVQRKLYPNVDFYSGIVQRAIGIPVNLFTGIFALARTVGWIAQLNEMIADPEYKIGRPRQLFTGANARDVKPVAER